MRLLVSVGLALGGIVMASCAAPRLGADAAEQRSGPVTLDLKATLAEWPIVGGQYWIYDTLETITTWDSKRHTLRGRATARIRDVVDGVRGRRAEYDVDVRVLELRSEDSVNRPIIGNPLPVTIVVLPGKAYSIAPFVASVAKERIARALDEGVEVMERWGQLPKYVFPLRVGNVWTDGRERFHVIARGPKEVKAGLFPDCFKIVGTTDEGDTEEWFCGGVGPVFTLVKSARRSIEQVLVGFGAR